MTMKVFVVLLLATVAIARPEAPYNYRVPQQPLSVSIPLPQISASSNFQSQQSIPATNYGTPNIATNFGASASQSYNQGYQQEFSHGFSASSSQFQQRPQELHHDFSSHSQVSSHFPTAPAPNLAPIIQKHIYVHVPPPEPIEEQQSFINAASAPRTNYKIIFIKAPSAPSVPRQVIQQQQQSQEKTIVYVLVKKPDEQEAFKLAGLAPTVPSKPEVYFIKYKANKEIAQDFSTSQNSGSATSIQNSGTAQAAYGAPPLISSQSSHSQTLAANGGYP